MLIDWFTVVAQLLNFVILLVALKFLLYDRVVRAMEERRRSIAEREEEARRRQQEAEEEAQRLREERRRVESGRQEVLDEAREEAERRQDALLQEARRDVEDQERRWWETVESSREQLLEELQRAAGDQARTLTRRALRDLADADLEAEIIRGLERRLRDLPDEERRRLAEGLRSTGEPVEVRTAFELADEDRERIRSGLNDIVEEELPDLRWERDPDLVAGVVIRVGAHRLSWGVNGYLEEARKALELAIRDEVAQAAAGAGEGSPLPGEDR